MCKRKFRPEETGGLKRTQKEPLHLILKTQPPVTEGVHLFSSFLLGEGAEEQSEASRYISEALCLLPCDSQERTKPEH